MPLLKRKPFDLVKVPEDLKDGEEVFQVRFTNEIFRSYDHYLERMNLYCQRVWTCKVTRKVGMTYEEALVSEQLATEGVKNFPKETVASVLKLIQYSELNLTDLVNLIREKFNEEYFEGEEINGKAEESVLSCKVLKVLNGLNGVNGRCYEVAWLDDNKNIVRVSVEKGSALMRKKLPFSRALLRSFIRDSTSRGMPWVVLEKLAKEHHIPVEPPEHLRCKIQGFDEHVESGKGPNTKPGASKLKKAKTGSNSQLALAHQTDESHQRHEETLEVEEIKYPIDDLLVKLCSDDPVFAERPVVCSNFRVPMDCVGNLIMIWDFCASFGKLLNLSPFSLDDFEIAINYKSNLNLISEVFASILNLIVEDGGDFYELVKNKKRQLEITPNNWMDYLLDFFEVEGVADFAAHLLTSRREGFNMIDIHTKLNIMSELVSWVVMTDAVRQKLDEYIEQQELLVATKRGEELEEIRKRREEKRLVDTKKNAKQKSLGASNECVVDSDYNDVIELVEGKSTDSDSDRQIPDAPKAQEDNFKLSTLASRRAIMKVKLEAKSALEKERERLRMKELERLREERQLRAKEAREKKLKEIREQHFEREMGKRFIRTNCLGKDRNYNRYWSFRRDHRLFVESADHNCWGYYSSKDELDQLIQSLNPKGERELALSRQLEKHYTQICSAFQRRAKEKAPPRAVVTDTTRLRRSVRVSVPPARASISPRKNSVDSFLNYVNKWR